MRDCASGYFKDAKQGGISTLLAIAVAGGLQQGFDSCIPY